MQAVKEMDEQVSFGHRYPKVLATRGGYGILNDEVKLKIASFRLLYDALVKKGSS